MKYLIMGLPGSGKTTLAIRLAPLIGAVLFDADDVRQNLWPELGYSYQDRIEQARRMRFLCDRVPTAIASFVCPTDETRDAFGPAFTIWIDRIKQSRFEDTNKMFVPPRSYDVRLSAGSVDDWLEILRVRNEAAFYIGASTFGVNFVSCDIATESEISSFRNVVSSRADSYESAASNVERF